MLGNNTVLPSKGFFYTNLVGGEVDILPMKTGQEELLAGRPEMIPILNSLINICVPTIAKSGMSPLDLLSGDRLFLLFMIRKVTYGSVYGFKIKCPSCNLSFREEINIPDDLEINELEKEPILEVVLSNKKKLGIRLLTGHDEVEIERFRSQAYKRGVKQGDPSYTYTIARHIISIDGKEADLRTALDFARDMYGMDSVILQNKIKEVEPGISRDLELECKKCGYEIETVLPYSSEFFRPKLRGGV